MGHVTQGADAELSLDADEAGASRDASRVCSTVMSFDPERGSSGASRGSTTGEQPSANLP